LARTRNVANRWLKECGLKYVTVSKNRYVYRPPPYKKETVLGKIHTARKDIITAYDNLKAGNFGTLRWMLEYYVKERSKERGSSPPLAARTLVDYANFMRVMLDDKYTKDGELLEKNQWFGKQGNPSLTQIKRTTIRQYLDHYPGAIQANLHIQFIKAAWNYVSERFTLPPNPCIGIRFNSKKGRHQLWSAVQYAAALEVAANMRNPYMFGFMELQYLQGARSCEVRQIKLSDVTDEGIHLKRTKGSKDEVTLWTPRLRAAYDFCRTIQINAPSPIDGAYLVHNKDGSMITESQYKQAAQRIKLKCKKAGVDLSDLHFHDLKANAAVDRPDNDVGHLDPKMQELYSRKRTQIKSRKATR
jgi:integrase